MSNKKQRIDRAKPWVIAADHARARFFSALVPQGPLKELDGLVNGDARLHDGDLVSDARGSLVHGRRSKNGGGHTAGDEHSAKNNVIEKFAQRVAKAVHKAHAVGAVSKVYLVAEPGFLGVLRTHLDENISRIVAGDIGLRLTDLTASEIRKHLPEML